MIPFPEPDWKILGREGGWERLRVRVGREDGGSDVRVGFDGEEELWGSSWDAVEVVLWVRVVDTVREDL